MAPEATPSDEPSARARRRPTTVARHVLALGAGAGALVAMATAGSTLAFIMRAGAIVLAAQLIAPLVARWDGRLARQRNAHASCPPRARSGA